MKGMSFDGVHTYENLHMVLSQVNIPPATPKTSFIDIPGGDGSVDLTEALGEVRYSNREGATFTFTVFPQDDFEEKKRQISNFLNGKRFERIILDKDPGYFWMGRCAINEYASDKNLHNIVVVANLAPYKLKVNQTMLSVPAGENTVITLENGRKSVVPTIVCTAPATIVFGAGEHKINAGTHVLSNILLKQGDNKLSVTSEEPVKFIYQEGDL